MFTAFQPSAFQNNSFQIGDSQQPVADSATPGYWRRSVEEYLRKVERKKAAQDAIAAENAAEQQPAKPITAPTSEADYEAKSRKLARAIQRFNAESAELRAKIAAAEEREKTILAERERKALERQLMLNRQALLLAETQRAVFMEEMEVLDIAYFAVLALTLH